MSVPLEQDLASIAKQCERLIRVHEYDPATDGCARCGRPWACYVRLTADDLLEGLRRLPLLDPALASDEVTREAGTTRSTGSDDGWHTSSFSENSGNCVEVKAARGVFAIRDSASPEGPLLIFRTGEWFAFTQGVRAGEFDE